MVFLKAISSTCIFEQPPKIQSIKSFASYSFTQISNFAQFVLSLYAFSGFFPDMRPEIRFLEKGTMQWHRTFYNPSKIKQIQHFVLLIGGTFFGFKFYHRSKFSRNLTFLILATLAITKTYKNLSSMNDKVFHYNPSKPDLGVTYQNAVEKEDAEAQHNLGLSYHSDKDLKEAKEWFLKAAKQEHVQAQYNLAACYYNGQGVDKDLKEFTTWLKKAAGQGHVKAQYNLAACYYNGQGVDKDPKETVTWLKKVEEQEHDANIQYNLGRAYECGDGVGKDLKEAKKWFKKATKQGHVKAQYCLDTIPRTKKRLKKTAKQEQWKRNTI